MSSLPIDPVASGYWKRIWLRTLALALLVILPERHAWAQDEYRAADTSSPRATLRSFIDSVNELYDLTQANDSTDRREPRHKPLRLRVLDCIDSSELPAFARDLRASEVAVCIKEILDRVELPPWDEIPGSEQVQRQDASGRELEKWRIPGTRLTIARVESGPRKYEYLFSPGTVDRVVSYYKDVAAVPYRTTGPKTSPGLYQWYFSMSGSPTLNAVVKHFPDWTKSDAAGAQIWKWPFIIVIVVLGVLAMYALYRIQHSLANRLMERRPGLYVLTIVFPIIAAAIPLFVVDLLEKELNLRGGLIYLFGFSAIAVSLVAAMVIAFALGNRLARLILVSPKINPTGLDAQLIRISCKLLSVLSAVVIFLAGGQHLGIPFTTLLASAGVGGIALALGAQDTLKTLFGTLALLADKPFRVGDRIIFQGYDGFVEDIGLRSTKLRLLTGNQVTLPNDHLASRDIENVGRRERIRHDNDLILPLDLPNAKVEQALEIVKTVLQEHEGMDAKFPPRVYFGQFTPEGYRLQFSLWYAPPDYWEFKSVCERINLKILESLEAAGIQLVPPRRHLFKDENLRPL